VDNVLAGLHRALDALHAGDVAAAKNEIEDLVEVLSNAMDATDAIVADYETSGGAARDRDLFRRKPR